MKDDLQLLRHALAAIWTELERDEPNLEDCQIIAGEALKLTKEHYRGKIPSCDIGLDSWRDYLAVQNKSLPVAQYRREVGEDTWYKRTSTDRTKFTVPVTCQRIVRELVNADEIMGMEYEYVGDNSTFADEGPVCRLTKFMRRHGKCWINKEDAEYLLHPKTMKPIRVWGEVEMAETLILTKSGVMGNKGVFDTGRTVGMTEKTQWAERKWVFDHTVSKDKYHFTVHREDCKPERIGDVQELFYKIDYHDGKDNRSIIYSLCGPVKDGKWKTEWNEKEQALMTNIVASVEGR